LLSLFFISSVNLYSQTIITGKANSYIGDTLYLCKYSDRITYTTEIVAKSYVDTSGIFNFNFNNDQTIDVFVDLPVLMAFLTVEKDKKYEIRIPQKIEMTDEQFLNPYFEKEKLPAIIVSPPENDINLLLLAYKSFLNKHKNELQKFKFKNEKFKYLDSVEKINDTIFSFADDSYFTFNKKYEFELLKYFFIQHDKQYLLDSLFSKTPVLFENSAYMSLFNYSFENCFKSGTSILPLPIIYKNISDKTFFNLKDTLKNYGKIENDKLAELIVIKGLYDKFYEDEQTQNNIIEMFLSITPTTVANENYLIIKKILSEINSLREGTPAPKLNLPDKKNNTFSFEKFKGEFVYLQFFHPKSYACQQHLTLLKSYHNKKIKKLNILTIFIGNNYDEMTDFLQKNKDIEWTFLFAEKNNNIIKKYKVENYPTYIFIDPEGNIDKLNAPSPTDNFEMFYNEKYKKWFEK